MARPPHHRHRLLLGLGCLALAAAAPPADNARQPPPLAPTAAVVPLRTGRHADFGRVVLDLPAGCHARLQRRTDGLLVRLSAGVVQPEGPLPPNLRAITPQADGVLLQLAPGTRLRTLRLGRRLVLDFLDPPSAEPAKVAATEPLPPPPPVPPSPATAAGVTATAVNAVASGESPAGKPVPQPARAATPPAAVAAPPTAPPSPAPAAATAPPTAPPSPAPASLTASAAPGGESVLLPFAPTAAAAAFRRGGEAVLVFDERRPIDVRALPHAGALGRAQVRLLPEGTELTFPLSPGQGLRLAHAEAGWTVQLGAGTASPSIDPALDTRDPALGPQLRLPLPNPGHTLMLADPLTGGTLLVGTEHAPAASVVVAHATPEFTLLPTWQGVAIAAISDELSLQQTDGGFVLRSALPGRGLALDSPGVDLAALDDAAALTRRFDFADLPAPALLRRLLSAEMGAGDAPPGRRTQARLAAVQALLALGFGAEADGLLGLVARSDPQAMTPDFTGLRAIAALLAGRLDASDGIDDPRLNGSDEITLWRALRTALLHPGAATAAATLAEESRLLLAYPAPLRARLLPLAVETMATGGEEAAAERLVDARPQDHSLDFARALLAERRQPEKALALFDRLAQSPDQLLRARAAPRAIDLRLALGQISVATAANAMDKLLYVWRGDRREVALRLRAAELRAEAGEPRAALALLRHALPALPFATDALRARMQQIFTAALAEDATTPLPPLELVATIEENPDLVPESESGLALARRLADRLEALDLPARAEPVFAKLVAAAAPGVVRAELGRRLAEVRLQLHDASGALSALGATAADSLPPSVLEQRVLVWARATAAEGDAARAAAALAGLGDSAALTLRARLLEQAQNWAGATAALRQLADASIPPDGPLTAPQAQTLLHLAADAAQANDAATLAQLRQHALPRMPAGHAADMLRLLTAPPVLLPADLPRARREDILAGALLGAAGH
jgi:hypothetical protein